MQLIYIAGPYRAPTVHGILENVRRAEAVALAVWQTGNVALCPHKNSAFFDGAVHDDIFLAGTIKMLKVCSSVILVRGWSTSIGTRLELEFCKESKTPVYESVEDFLAGREMCL